VETNLKRAGYFIASGARDNYKPMKLELGQMNGSTLPGKIFLALNDGQQTVAARKFEATVSAPTPAPAVATPPPPNPTGKFPPPNAARTPMEQRYGIHQ